MSTNSTVRLIAGLGAVFAIVLVFSEVVGRVVPRLSTAASIAMTGCIVIYFNYRWRCHPPHYERQLEEIRSLAILSPLIHDRYLPLSLWTLEPQTLVEIANLIQTDGSEAIVECGSGVSTVVIGSLLRQMKRGHLFTIEDNERWYRWVSDLVHTQQLDDCVTLVQAPLEPLPEGLGPGVWYATAPILDALRDVRRVDLVIVDGPKTVDWRSRAPALPFFQQWMDERSLMVLDDASRAHEQLMLENWKKSFDLEIVLRATLKGEARIRLKSTPQEPHTTWGQLRED